jgi:hypothetical protein
MLRLEKVTRFYSGILPGLSLKMEAICSSETSADIQRTTRRYIPEERAPLKIRENLKSYIGVELFPRLIKLQTKELTFCRCPLTILVYRHVQIKIEDPDIIHAHFYQSVIICSISCFDIFSRCIFSAHCVFNEQDSDGESK